MNWSLDIQAEPAVKFSVNRWTVDRLTSLISTPLQGQQQYTYLFEAATYSQLRCREFRCVHGTAVSPIAWQLSQQAQQ
jgi:hypothetical protein